MKERRPHGKSKRQSSKQQRRGGLVETAQVIVRSKSGKRIRGDVEITSRNISEYEPAPEDVAVAQKAFQTAGFEVGPLVGISFSVTAPLSGFERFFSTKLFVDTSGVVQTEAH